MAKNAKKRRDKRVPEATAATLYSDSQLCVAAAYVDHILARRWFDGLFGGAEQTHMARLLVGIFLTYETGSLPTKSQAMAFMNAVDGRTSQRYIGLAQEHKLLTVAQSKIDQRVDLLCPTEKLLVLVRGELSKVADELRAAIHALSISDWIKTGTEIPDPPPISRPFLPIVHSGTPGPGPSLFGMPSVREMLADQIATEKNITSADYLRKSVTKFTETIRLAPKNVAAYRHRGELYHGEGEYEKAIADYSQAIKLDATNAWTFSQRGDVYVQLKMFEQALADYTEAINFDAGGYEYYYRRGQIYLTTGNYDRAVSDFTLAISYAQREPSSSYALAPYYVHRALAYLKKGEREHVLADMTTAGLENISDFQRTTNISDLQKAIGKFLAQLERDGS